MDDKFARQQQAEQANAAAYCTAMNHAANILGGQQQTMSAEFMNRAAGYGPGLASGQIGSARDKGEIEQQIDALRRLRKVKSAIKKINIHTNNRKKG